MANEFFIPTFPNSSNLDAALATSLPEYSKTITDNVYNANVLLKWLNGRKRTVDGGLSIVYPLIKGDQNAGGFYTGAQALNVIQTDQETQCEYKWQNAYEPIQLTRDEERYNSGDVHKIIDLVGEKIERSELALAKRLEQAFSTPVSGAGNLIDLETLVNTGTLGTIAGGTQTFWQSTVTASGSFAAQGMSDMTTATYAVSSAANIDNPTIYMTNKTVFQYFENTRLPLERIQNGDLSANAGFKNFTFKGVPVVYGNFIGSGLLFGLNENYIEYVVDSQTDMAMTPFVTPVNQTVKVAFILFRGNLTTNNRRRHFKLTGITA
jgi:hypothetical protein